MGTGQRGQQAVHRRSIRGPKSRFVLGTGHLRHNDIAGFAATSADLGDLRGGGEVAKTTGTSLPTMAGGAKLHIRSADRDIAPPGLGHSRRRICKPGEFVFAVFVSCFGAARGLGGRLRGLPWQVHGSSRTCFFFRCFRSAIGCLLLPSRLQSSSKWGHVPSATRSGASF